MPTVPWGSGVVALVGWLAACQPLIEPGAPRAAELDSGDRRVAGRLDDRSIEFAFDGGQLEFELYRDGTRIEQVVRNRYAVPVTLRWSIGGLDNLEASSSLEGTTVLPAAREPLGPGEPVVLAELSQIEP
ncbi:MAG TPA: hypothetical protein VF516_01245, partial [Kofleriaceae bacterium]